MEEKDASKRRWMRPSRLESAGNKRQSVYNIIHALNCVKVESLEDEAGIDRVELKSILEELKSRGLVYAPRPGVIGCVED